MTSDFRRLHLTKKEIFWLAKRFTTPNDFMSLKFCTKRKNLVMSLLPVRSGSSETTALVLEFTTSLEASPAGRKFVLLPSGFALEAAKHFLPLGFALGK